MANTLFLNQPFVSVGLGTFIFTVPSDGIYNVTAQSTETPPSSLVIIVKKNGSTIYTAPVIGQYQSALQFRREFLFAASDAIEIDLTSSQPIDNQLNTLKTTVQLGTGQ